MKVERDNKNKQKINNYHCMNKSDFENIKSTLTKNGKAGKLPTSNKFYNPITKPSKKFKPSVHYYYEGDNKAHQPNYTYLKEMQEQLEFHNAKKEYAIFQNKRRYQDEAQAYFNEIQRLEGEKLRHHPSSETSKTYSEMIKKKKGIINQLRQDFDF